MCFSCWCVFVWNFPWWALAQVLPGTRDPTQQELDAVKGMRSSAHGIIEAYHAIATKEHDKKLGVMRGKAGAARAAAASSAGSSGSTTVRGAISSAPTAATEETTATLMGVGAELMGKLKDDPEIDQG